MFNMCDVGNRISVLRKNAGLTQMELANRLSISYQAVSNWERGLAMPDISNLALLSEILSVSVDDIINDKKLSALITDEEAIEKSSEFTPEEFNAISPLLSAEKNAKLIEKVKFYDNNEKDTDNINLPSLGFTQEDFDSFAIDAAERNDVAQFALFAPKISENTMKEICRKTFESGNIPIFTIVCKYLSGPELKEYLKKAQNNGMMPFIAVLLNRLSNENREQ